METTQKKNPSALTEKEKQSKLNNNEQKASFLERNYALFFAPIIVLTLYIMALINYKIYPFGEEYTVASYDLSAQICPLIEHLFDVLSGRSSLFYSHAVIGGTDMTGSFLYFFLSPFSFLFLIFGEGNVARAAGIVMAAKLATVSVAGTWFAKKMFKGIPDYLCIAIGIVYTYCGYMFVANTYINWVDFLIYMPFTTAAFKHFVKTEKFLPFAILMACCIYTCFSIACFSMFTVFPTLIVYAIFCVEKEKRNKFITKLCLAFVTAVLFALPVLLPAGMAYLRGARSGDSGVFANLWKGFKDMKNPVELNTESFMDTFTQNIYKKWTYIVSDAIFIILTFVWLYRSDFKKPFVKFMLVAGAFTLLPTIVDEAMVLMNMGSYMSYALRFGFLNALYFLGGACLCLENLCYKEGCAYDGEELFSMENAATTNELKDVVAAKEEMIEDAPKNQNEGGMSALNIKTSQAENVQIDKKQRNLWAIVMGAVGLIVTFFIFYFTKNDNYKDGDFWGLFIQDSETLKSFKGFSASFAHSLGGMQVVLVLAGAVAVACLVGFYLLSKKKISIRLLSYVLIVVVGSQVIFYNDQLVIGNRSTQHVTLDTYTRLCEQLNEDDGTYFRVKDYKKVKENGDYKLKTIVTANAPFTANTNAFSMFSSMIDKDNFATYEMFGFDSNGKNSYKTAHSLGKVNRSEEFGDSFLGYKYFIVPKSNKGDFNEGQKFAKYIKPYMVKNEKGEEVQLSDDDFYVYVNEIVFPNAYVLPRGDYRFRTLDLSNKGNYRKENQQELYKFLRGVDLADMKDVTGSNSSTFVTPETARELSEYLWERAVDIEVTAGKITAHVKNAKAGEALFMNFVASKGYEVTVNGKKAELIDNDLKFLSVTLEEGENEVVFEYSTPYVKYMAVGVGGALIGLLAVAFVVKKTKLVDWASPVVAWTGIALATAIVAVFMLYPSVACLIKFMKFV